MVLGTDNDKGGDNNRNNKTYNRAPIDNLKEEKTEGAGEPKILSTYAEASTLKPRSTHHFRRPYGLASALPLFKLRGITFREGATGFGGDALQQTPHRRPSWPSAQNP